MIYIIHGDDEAASYNELQRLITKSAKTTYFDCEKNQLKDLELMVESQELFADKKTIVIQNPKKVTSKQIDEFSRLVNKFEEEGLGDTVIYSSSFIDEKLILKLKKPSISVYKLPQLFFQFLDSFSPNSYKKTLFILSQLRETAEDEQIFYALLKRIRFLIMVKLSNEQKFEELEKMQSWQRGKLHKQADEWLLGNLLDLNRELYQAEVDLKSSGIATSLADRLDNIIVSKVH